MYQSSLSLSLFVRKKIRSCFSSFFSFLNCKETSHALRIPFDVWRCRCCVLGSRGRASVGAGEDWEEREGCETVFAAMASETRLHQSAPFFAWRKLSVSIKMPFRLSLQHPHIFYSA